jgi:hypothetical protein
MRPARMVGVASAITSPHSGVLARGGRATVAAFAFGAVLLFATPARADCLLLDLDCVAEAASGAAAETAEEATEAVDEVVEGVTNVTEPATTTVVVVVESVVTTVEEAVDDVVAVVEEAAEVAIGGGSPEEPGPGTDDDITEERPEADPRPGSVVASGPDPGTVTPHAPAGTDATPGAGVPSLVGANTAPSGEAPASAASPDKVTAGDTAAAERLTVSPPAVRDAGPSALAEVARTLAFPLALTVLIALFLLAQHRVDRRAPKLALAPVEPDVVGFRRAAGD